MNSWKIILATVVIFGAGVVTGGLLVNYVSHPRSGNHHANAPARGLDDLAPRPELLKTNFVERLDDAVHLTPGQRQQIEKIVADGQQRNRNIWKLASPQFHAVTQDVRHRIRDVLTPAQQEKFEGLMKHSAHQPAPASAGSPTNLPPVVLTNSPAA